MEAAASEFGYYAQLTSDMRLSDQKSGENFIIDDLLDFSNDDGGFNSLTGNSTSTDSPAVVTPVDSYNSPFSGNNILSRTFHDSQFAGDLCVPYDDVAELEWLSNFVEESFSSEDLHKLPLISGMPPMKTRPDESSETRYYQEDPNPITRHLNSPVFSPEIPVPGKARSKRSRAAPCDWSSRLLVLSSTTTLNNLTQPGAVLSGSVSKLATKPGKKNSGDASRSGSRSDLPNGEVQKCLHCTTNKTPQWRTGPMGPKTLCNACGVRYKSGRLVPEYRPAASPTFVLTKHSNSHRKVMELRKQKELIRQQQHEFQQQQLIHHSNSIMFHPSNNDDYLIYQHIGPDFRPLI